MAGDHSIVAMRRYRAGREETIAKWPERASWNRSSIRSGNSFGDKLPVLLPLRMARKLFTRRLQTPPALFFQRCGLQLGDETLLTIAMITRRTSFQGNRLYGLPYRCLCLWSVYFLQSLRFLLWYSTNYYLANRFLIILNISFVFG